MFPPLKGEGAHAGGNSDTLQSYRLVTAAVGESSTSARKLYFSSGPHPWSNKDGFDHHHGLVLAFPPANCSSAKIPGRMMEIMEIA